MVTDGRFRHEEVIPQSAGKVLETLLKRDLGSFYLAGGTALALHFGHRLSRDLDFFSARPFDEERLLQDLKEVEKLSVVAKGRQTLHLHILGVRVSFLGYDYPLLFPLEEFKGVPVADVRDIACMKISAIAGRGSRRDFVDLYVTAKEYGLVQLLELFNKKYAQIEFNVIHVLKSLTYFEDAENEPMPKMLLPISWGEITGFFRQEAPKLI